MGGLHPAGGSGGAPHIMALTRNLFLVAFGGPVVVFAAGWLSGL